MKRVTPALVTLAACAAVVVAPAAARVPPPPPASPLPLPAGWTTDETPAAVAIASGRVYIGGNFSRIGPVTGGGVALDTGSTYQPQFPFILGRVFAVVEDGQGGFYIGGHFNTVGGQRRGNLARIHADGTVDTAFAPGVDGDVKALARDGARLYVGGSFVHVNGLIRRRLTAMNGDTGEVDQGFNPGVDRTVNDLALAPGKLFVAGQFRGISGNARTTIAAVNPQTGDLDPDFDATPDGTAMAVQVIGDRVFVGGDFHIMNGRSRSGLAAFDIPSGQITSFSPSVNGHVRELASDGQRLFVGGEFTEIERSFNTSLASLDPQTGKASQEFRAFVDGEVRALSFSNGRLYLGGAFLKVDGLKIDRLASVDATTGAVDPAFHPDPNNDVEAVATAGDKIYAGGFFTSGRRFPVYGLAALDAVTGYWDPSWVAGVQGTDGGPGRVNTLAVHDGRLYAGGSFVAADAASRHNLAAFDLATGALSAFRAEPNGQVSSIAFSGNRAFLGGDFERVRGQFHYELASVDARSGAPSARFNHGTRKHPGPVSNVSALNASGERLWVGGTVRTGFVFRGKGKKRRKVPVYENLVSVSQLTAGVKRAFKAKVQGEVVSLAGGGRRLYAGGFISRISGFKVKVVKKNGKRKKVKIPKYRFGLVALDPRTGHLNLRFNPKASEASSLAVGAHGLYATGGFRVSTGKRRRDGVALFDLKTGVPLGDFHPEPRTPRNEFASVGGVAAAGERVAIVGEFSWIGTAYQPFVAVLPVPEA